ncbi:hypothetical protein HDE_10704 [Halotydeus destructor]|nr:hypothetical protein HDE_10704 [Halotydeus destructor]
MENGKASPSCRSDVPNLLGDSLTSRLIPKYGSVPLSDTEELEGPSLPAPGYLYRPRSRRRRQQGDEEACEAWTRVAFGSLLGLTCLFIVFMVLPVVMMFIGIKFISSCPAIPAVPVLLIIAGSLMAASNIINILDQVCSCCLIPATGRGRNLVIVAVNVVINGLILVTLLALSVWIYGTPRPLDHRDLDHQFCDPLLYVFTYCLINFLWIFAAVISLIVLTFCCCVTFV